MAYEHAWELWLWKILVQVSPASEFKFRSHFLSYPNYDDSNLLPAQEWKAPQRPFPEVRSPLCSGGSPHLFHSAHFATTFWARSAPLGTAASLLSPVATVTPLILKSSPPLLFHPKMRMRTSFFIVQLRPDCYLVSVPSWSRREDFDSETPVERMHEGLAREWNSTHQLYCGEHASAPALLLLPFCFPGDHMAPHISEYNSSIQPHMHHQ